MPSILGLSAWLWVVGALVLLIGTAAVCWWRGTRGAEDVARLSGFLAALNGYDWKTAAGRHVALDGFRSELLTLFEAEVRYYYSARRRHRPVSMMFRVLGWLFGSLGVIIPALAAYFDAARGAAPFGYVFIVAAGCMFGGNQLFGGTSGHARYVSAQYEIEAHLVAFTIKWERWRALHQHAEIGDEALTEPFGLLQDLAATIYGVIRTETGGWAAALQEATRKAADDVSARIDAAKVPTGTAEGRKA